MIAQLELHWHDIILDVVYPSCLKALHSDMMACIVGCWIWMEQRPQADLPSFNNIKYGFSSFQSTSSASTLAAFASESNLNVHMNCKCPARTCHQRIQSKTSKLLMYCQIANHSWYDSDTPHIRLSTLFPRRLSSQSTCRLSWPLTHDPSYDPVTPAFLTPECWSRLRWSPQQWTMSLGPRPHPLEPALSRWLPTACSSVTVASSSRPPPCRWRPLPGARAPARRRAHRDTLTAHLPRRWLWDLSVVRGRI